MTWKTGKAINLPALPHEPHPRISLTRAYPWQQSGHTGATDKPLTPLQKSPMGTG